MDPTFQTLVDLANKLGVFGLVVIFSVAMVREWVVTGTRFRKLEMERDVLLGLLQLQGRANEQAIQTNERVVDKLAKPQLRARGAR